MQINNTNSPNFQAKFLKSDSLKEVVNYAIEHNKFEQLNTARKNIDNSYLRTRLFVAVGADEAGNAQVRFTRYMPKYDVLEIKSTADCLKPKTFIYTSSKPMNPLKFALQKIIKLGNNAPNNNMYQNVVAKK